MTSCFICARNGVAKAFKHLDNLEKHFERQHPDEERLCVRCNKTKNIIDNDMIYHDICKRCINKEKCDKCKKYYRKCYIDQHDCSYYSKEKDTRYCNQCKVVKPLGEFYASKYRCIKCLKEKEECAVCSKMILKKYMNHHKVIHQESTLEKRKCNQCSIMKN
jgi:hypothetical protein